MRRGHINKMKLHRLTAIKAVAAERPENIDRATVSSITDRIAEVCADNTERHRRHTARSIFNTQTQMGFILTHGHDARQTDSIEPETRLGKTTAVGPPDQAS